jgi:hypothetical protein
MSLVGALLLGTTGLFGCATTAPLRASTAVPAAEGHVKVAAGDNGNTKLDINVKHLARPDKLAAGATSFVVWARSPMELSAPPQNLGALRVNDDLEGSLQTVTPLKQLDLTITPEMSPAASAPTGAPVMTAHISR